jgi:hypothetical protein
VFLSSTGSVSVDGVLGFRCGSWWVKTVINSLIDPDLFSHYPICLFIFCKLATPQMILILPRDLFIPALVKYKISWLCIRYIWFRAI